MKNPVAFLSVILGIYLLVCILMYFFQEKMIFFPQTLPKDFTFQFDHIFEERFIEMKDGTNLHALLFKTENPKGVIFYLHGNAGSLQGWGSVAETFVDLNYDVLVLDYRGYGKSEGSITGEAQLYEDIQIVYDHLKQEYPEKQITVLGHSIGAGMAAKVASANSPRLLILQAPFYSLPDLANNTFPLNLFPAFLIRYKFKTWKFLREADMPVVILHGDEDEIIGYDSSLKLQREFKAEDTLITLKGAGHNNFLGTERYRNKIEMILEK